MLVFAAFLLKKQNMSPQNTKSFFFCCLQQLLWCLWKQTLFPEVISTPGIQAQQLPAQRDMGPGAARMVRLHRNNPKRSLSRRQCTPGLPHQCFRSFLMNQAEIQALKYQCKVSPKKGTWNSQSPELYTVSNFEQDTIVKVEIIWGT